MATLKCLLLLLCFLKCVFVFALWNGWRKKTLQKDTAGKPQHVGWHMCSKMYVGHFTETILVVRQKISFDDKTFLNNIFEHIGPPISCTLKQYFENWSSEFKWNRYEGEVSTHVWWTLKLKNLGSRAPQRIPDVEERSFIFQIYRNARSKQ